jgi:putative aldouronate transport system permease protein
MRVRGQRGAALRQRKSLKHRIIRFLPMYFMMIPGIVYLIVNNYIPMAGIIVAFKRMNYQLGLFQSPWVGLSNFEFLFATRDAWTITRNTICYNLVFIVLGTSAAVMVAVLLTEIRAKLAVKAYQLTILFPITVSIVIVSYLVFGFLSKETGFLNKGVLEPLGARAVSWYYEPKYWPFILTIVNLWKGLGFGSIIYYATLLGIDNTYYESAVIDGATRWQRIRYIMLPFLKPTISILVLLSVSKIFYSDFGLFYQVPNNSGPLINVTNTIDTYVYRGLIKLSANSLGMASAANFYQSVVGFILVLSANYFVKKLDENSALF